MLKHERIEQAEVLVSQGLDAHAIASAMNCDVRTIQRYVKYDGLTPPAPRQVAFNRRGGAKWYVYVFFAHNGPGPYDCCFCETPVTMDEVVVHHDDEDRSNDDPSNLKPAHVSCHHTYHGRNPSQTVGKATT